MKALILGGFLLFVTLLSTGCVVGRRTISLPVTHQDGAALGSKGEFVLAVPEDARHFENKPAHPSTPSIDGDVNALSPDQLATMIGRQRNGYGHAMGDIALAAPDTVKTRMAELVKEGLTRRGYSVSSGSGTGSTVTITIDDFWAWFTPKFVILTFEARVRAKITLKQGEKSATLTVEGYGSNQGQVASDANWQLAYSRAFDHFLESFDKELANAGF